MKIIKLNNCDLIKFELLVDITYRNIYSNPKIIFIKNLSCNSKEYVGEYSVTLKETSTGYELYMPSEFMNHIGKDSLVLNLDEYKEEIKKEIENSTNKCLDQQLISMRNDYKNNKKLIVKYFDLTGFYIENIEEINEHYIKLESEMNQQQESILKKIPGAENGFEISMQELIKIIQYKSETRRMQ